MSVLALVAKAAEEHGTGTHRGSKGSKQGKVEARVWIQW